MKTPVSPRMVAICILSTMAPLSAQNLISCPRSPESNNSEAYDGTSDSRFSENYVAPGNYDVPAMTKARGKLPDGKPVYTAQDSLTLNARASSPQNVESVVDLSVLRNPSPYRKVAVSTGNQPYTISEDSLQTGLALISAVYRESGKPEKGTDCVALSLSVEQRIKLDASQVLQIVGAEVAANPSCVCEIVKTAIKASDADVALVVSIVETSIGAAPESMRMASQCAIATMPDSVAEVQALLAKLDPNSGDSGQSSKGAKSAKSAKSAKVAAIMSTPPNPLDFPPIFPPVMPPPNYCKPVSNVNPCGCIDGKHYD